MSGEMNQAGDGGEDRRFVNVALISAITALGLALDFSLCYFRQNIIPILLAPNQQHDPPSGLKSRPQASRQAARLGVQGEFGVDPSSARRVRPRSVLSRPPWPSASDRSSRQELLFLWRDTSLCDISPGRHGSGPNRSSHPRRPSPRPRRLQRPTPRYHPHLPYPNLLILTSPQLNPRPTTSPPTSPSILPP